MGKKKPATKKHITKAKSAHKPVKKTAAKPTKPKHVKSTPVAKKSSASHHDAKPAKSHARPAATKPKPEPARPPAAKTKAPADAAAADAAARLSPEELRKQLVAKARARTKTPRAVAFTLDDVRGELARSRPTRKDRVTAPAKSDGATKSGGAHSASSRAAHEAKPSQRRLGAASLADILGYNPAVKEKPEDDEATIDKKFLRYYKLLVQLREHVKSGLAIHAEDTLKRSNREDSGDLSGYGQHMADAGTDNFDRDFALSLVSNEQEALYEIEEAIKRIKNGTYGNCELTGKPINKDRLLAVPFARYSVESQAEVEKTRRRSSQRAGVFADTGTEEGAKIAEEESE